MVVWLQLRGRGHGLKGLVVLFTGCSTRCCRCSRGGRRKGIATTHPHCGSCTGRGHHSELCPQAIKHGPQGRASGSFPRELCLQGSHIPPLCIQPRLELQGEGLMPRGLSEGYLCGSEPGEQGGYLGSQVGILPAGVRSSTP